jgi:hypothetical protein
VVYPHLDPTKLDEAEENYVRAESLDLMARPSVVAGDRHRGVSLSLKPLAETKISRYGPGKKKKPVAAQKSTDAGTLEAAVALVMAQGEAHG